MCVCVCVLDNRISEIEPCGTYVLSAFTPDYMLFRILFTLCQELMKSTLWKKSKSMKGIQATRVTMTTGNS